MTKRDVQVHAAHPYTDKRLFTFQFASGDRVRMSLVKRSVVTTDTKIVENFSDRREEYFLQSRDCYFLGPVEQENAGYASLGFCNGQVVCSRDTVYACIHSKDYISSALHIKMLYNAKHMFTLSILSFFFKLILYYFKC